MMGIIIIAFGIFIGLFLRDRGYRLKMGKLTKWELYNVDTSRNNP